jgi:8-oxo-dGTP diphosphatase
VTNRKYPQRPILGVGALIFRDDRILLAERAREPLKGFWSIPGGVVEVGETLEEAVRREVREETNLEIVVVDVIEIFERIMRDGEGRPEYHYVLIDYLCLAKAGEAQAADDVARTAWVRRGELQDYRITEGTPRVIQKGFDAAARIAV